MLPVIEPDGRRAGRQAFVYAVALVVTSAIPTLVGISGTAYLAAALALGVTFAWLALRFAMARTDETARWLFFGSILYLPLLWTAMIADRL
jgi:protoheme IX farnesyltransferase